MRSRIIMLCMAICAAMAIPAQAGAADEIDLRRACLDTVWQTVYEYHYDPTFGGVDWQEIHDRYNELVVATADDDSLIALLNQMLLELKLSHYAVFRIEDKSGSGSPLLSGGSVGIDLRLLENDAVITALNPDFPAALAGMKPGYLIKSINGTSLEQILNDASARQVPHFNQRLKISNMCDKVISYFFGQPGDTVMLSYEDENDLRHDAVLQMKERSGGTKIADNFPTIYFDFKAQIMNKNIGYINFNAFVPPVDSLFLAAMDSMGDIQGLIIDIRGNPGGMHEIGEAIASKMISQKTLFSVFKYRDSTVQVSLDPDPPVFEGPIAILIDIMNGSASERFSACMQSIGRAKIVGEWSPGSVGPSDIKVLPNGASFMYLVAQSLTPDGTVLEGYGVVPDIKVALDRSALLKGVDTQIERAIAYVESEIKGSNIRQNKGE